MKTLKYYFIALIMVAAGFVAPQISDAQSTPEVFFETHSVHYNDNGPYFFVSGKVEGLASGETIDLRLIQDAPNSQEFEIGTITGTSFPTVSFNFPHPTQLNTYNAPYTLVEGHSYSIISSDTSVVPVSEDLGDFPVLQLGQASLVNDEYYQFSGTINRESCNPHYLVLYNSEVSTQYNSFEAGLPQFKIMEILSNTWTAGPSGTCNDIGFTSPPSGVGNTGPYQVDLQPGAQYYVALYAKNGVDANNDGINDWYHLVDTGDDDGDGIPNSADVGIGADDEDGDGIWDDADISNASLSRVSELFPLDSPVLNNLIPGLTSIRSQDVNGDYYYAFTGNFVGTQPGVTATFQLIHIDTGVPITLTLLSNVAVASSTPGNPVDPFQYPDSGGFDAPYELAPGNYQIRVNYSDGRAPDVFNMSDAIPGDPGTTTTTTTSTTGTTTSTNTPFQGSDVNNGIVDDSCGYNLGNGGGRICGFNDLISLVQRIIEYIFILILPIAAIMFAYAGYQMMTSQDNANKRTAAKNMMGKVLLGIIIVMAAWLLVRTLVVGLGVDPTVRRFLG